jgi:hypothetical protein
MKRIALSTGHVLAIAFALAGCTTRGLSDAKAKEHVPPLLNVTSPDRGTIAGNATVVEVKGTASDAGSGLKNVTINGTVVSVGADGSFDATIPTKPGITLLHTSATDNDDNVTNDSRAVMAGTLADAATPIQDGLVARINDKTLNALGDIGAEELTAFDVGAAVQPYNPIVDAGITCVNAQVDVDSIAKDLVLLDLTPVNGGIAFTAELDNLDVEMTTYFKAVCIPGSAGISLTADKYRLAGTFDLGVDANGVVQATLVNAAGSFDNFNLQVGIIPQSVLDLFISNIDQRVANMITTQLQGKVPALVQKYLGGYGYEKTISVMGEDLDILVKPTAIDFNTSGGTIDMDSTIAIKTNNAGPGYPFIPSPLPSMPQNEAPGDGFRVAISDNTVNQALYAFWEAGLMDRTIDLNQDGSATGLLALVDQVQLYMPFPPVATSDIPGQAITVTIGDLMIVASHKDANGVEQPVTKIAASAEIGLVLYVDPTNNIRLAVNTPTSYLDVVNDGTVVGPNPLNDASLEALGGYVIGHASTLVDGVVGAIPVPQFQSATIQNLTTSAAPTGGYVELGGNIVAQ